MLDMGFEPQMRKLAGDHVSKKLADICQSLPDILGHARFGRTSHFAVFGHVPGQGADFGKTVFTKGLSFH